MTLKIRAQLINDQTFTDLPFGGPMCRRLR
jgi:hypothetical protein